MSHSRWYLILGISLAATSVAVYLLQILIFHNAHDTLFYLFQDIAFVPVQALLVMLVIDKLLQKKEKESLLNKMNMMIGVFFNEMGSDLISLFLRCDKNLAALRERLEIGTAWTAKDFEERTKYLRSFNPEVGVTPGLLLEMKSFLLERRSEMLRLLENPNLMEHDAFTDLLWAAFHLVDELHHRQDFNRLPATDINHIRGDIARAYRLIVIEWLQYMKHLKTNYPYLFSIAVRTNPFNPDARIEVTS